jgi:stage II sporulation protein D
LPIIFTKKELTTFSKEVVNEETNTNENSYDDENTEYTYNKYAMIKLLHTENEEIEELPIDEYLKGVVSAEMPVSYEIEALKAQAVVARTYTIYKINNKKHENADICDDSSCCQAWISKEDRLLKWQEDSREANWEKIEKCVNETVGKIIIYDGQVINAFFHSNSGGTTEIPANVWGGSGYPYLQIVETAGEDAYSQYASEVVLSKDELLNKLKVIYDDIEINFENTEDIKITEYTESGRVKTVKFGNKNISGVELRQILGLKSTNFEITIEEDNVKFNVKGYGHGVGMSQTGADAMAKSGANYEEIIKHFYTGVEIEDINSL